MSTTLERTEQADFALAVPMFMLTLLSMFWVGAEQAGVDFSREDYSAIARGWSFAVPLITILLAHEFGHYFAARIHHVGTSLPYFIPMPFTMVGTFGAVLNMREPTERNALFDIGAAGPLAGLVVTLLVLIYGIISSPVVLQDPSMHYAVEGRSLLYLGLLALLKGPIPAGHDILLTPTAIAGWAGLLVTMVNLVPVGQLDGGHVAYALLGERQTRYSRRMRWLMVAVALVVGLHDGTRALLADKDLRHVTEAFLVGWHWLLWAAVLALMSRVAGEEHPPVEGELSPRRRVLAWLTLGLFVLLFMPVWMSTT